MSAYYYLIASLPALSYDADRPVSIEDFLDACAEQMGRNDLGILKSSSIRDVDDSEKTCRVLDRWRNWEKNLRNQLVMLRAQKKGADPGKYKKECAEIFGMREIAADVFSQESPLSAEETLNRLRWSYLEDLEFGHYFDIEKLIIYYLKLQILQRKSYFNYTEGDKNFKALVEYNQLK